MTLLCDNTAVLIVVVSFLSPKGQVAQAIAFSPALLRNTSTYIRKNMWHFEMLCV
jgi:hypothetical protein